MLLARPDVSTGPRYAEAPDAEEIVQDFYDGIGSWITSGDRALDLMVTPEFIDHPMAGADPLDRSAFFSNLTSIRDTMPELQFEITRIETAGTIVSVDLTGSPGSLASISGWSLAVARAGRIPRNPPHRRASHRRTLACERSLAIWILVRRAVVARRSRAASPTVDTELRAGSEDRGRTLRLRDRGCAGRIGRAVGRPIQPGSDRQGATSPCANRGRGGPYRRTGWTIAGAKSGRKRNQILDGEPGPDTSATVPGGCARQRSSPWYPADRQYLCRRSAIGGWGGLVDG